MTGWWNPRGLIAMDLQHACSNYTGPSIGAPYRRSIAASNLSRTGYLGEKQPQSLDLASIIKI